MPEWQGPAARADWEQRVGRRRESAATALELAPPRALWAESGGGQVTLRWQPAPGAAGYVVQRAARRDGPFKTIDHGGGDVLAVPGPTYADTTGRPGEDAWYAVASLAAADGRHGPLTAPVHARAGEHRGAIELTVDAAEVVGPLARPWHMVGSEHLSQLFYGRDERGIDIGKEFAEAFRLAYRELGVDRVRAHGILLDELGVYRESGGRPVFDFSRVDHVYDRLIAIGLRPVVELSFMPRALARDPSATVFDYRAIVSPPRDWGRWRELVGAFAAHLVERYGIDEVEDWGFEVWNEPNLEVFWAGTRSEYLRLYDEAAAAIKHVDARLKVGGPATAAAGWIVDFAVHARDTGTPVDFLSTHTYGNLPLDVAATADDAGLGRRPVWWTEWGVSPTHFGGVNDSVLGGPFVLHGVHAAMDRADYLAYWVVSDHFEELGRPARLFHGGFGLLTVGNLRKARYWALRMLEMLGPDRVRVEVRGDGAESLVQAQATSRPSGQVDLLVWNGTLDQTKAEGASLLDRSIRLRFSGLKSMPYRCEHWRLDPEHSNILKAWHRLGSPDWPDAAGWARLRSADRMEAMGPPAAITAKGGEIALEFRLPMPAASLIQLLPEA